tara:strand:- start:721 stop:1143 length:423 start_codon:yes stop_codon:yes gene_type:complete
MFEVHYPAPLEQFAPGVEMLIDNAITQYEVPLAPMSNKVVASFTDESSNKRPREEGDVCANETKSYKLLNANQAASLRGSTAFVALKSEFMTEEIHSYLTYLASRTACKSNQPLDTHMYTEIFRKMATVFGFMRALDRIG